MKNLAHINRMRKSYKTILFNILLVILVCFISYLIYLYKINNNVSEAQNNQLISTAAQKIVKFKGSSFIVDVADTPEKRMTGLMHVKSLDQNKGMLFIFDKEDRYGFWMKNTYIPLDIIWLDKDKKIVFMSENTKPCENRLGAVCQVITPIKTSLYTVEFNSGKIKELGLKPGDKAEF